MPRRPLHPLFGPPCVLFAVTLLFFAPRDRYQPEHSAPAAPVHRRDAHAIPATQPAGDVVSVRGYYRRDGTYVRPHTRRSPQ